MTHACPVDGCRVSTVPAHMLMCPRHWKKVPREQQRALYAAWDRGAGAGTPAHQDAMRACIHAVEAAETEETKP